MRTRAAPSQSTDTDTTTRRLSDVVRESRLRKKQLKVKPQELEAPKVDEPKGEAGTPKPSTTPQQTPKLVSMRTDPFSPQSPSSLIKREGKTVKFSEDRPKSSAAAKHPRTPLVSPPRQPQTPLSPPRQPRQSHNTTTPTTVQKFQSFKLPVALASEKDYTQIKEGLLHPVLDALDGEKESSSPWSFPAFFQTNWYTQETHARLIASNNNPEACFAAYSNINLATQWIFRGKVNHPFYSAPAQLYEWAARAKNARKSELTNDLPIARYLTFAGLDVDGRKGFFEKDIIDITVYHAHHYSKAFIVNLDDAVPFLDAYGDNDPMPCIVYGNSLENSKTHSPETVAAVLRHMLNTIIKSIIPEVGQIFNKKSLPVFQINGSYQPALFVATVNCSCCNTNTSRSPLLILVPRQADGYSCGYQGMLMRNAMLAAHGEGRKIVHSDRDDSLASFAKQYFSYENVASVATLRVALSNLTMGLSRLSLLRSPKNGRGVDSSSNKDEDEDEEESEEESGIDQVWTKKKVKTDLVKKTAKKSKKKPKKVRSPETKPRGHGVFERMKSNRATKEEMDNKAAVEEEEEEEPLAGKLAKHPPRKHHVHLRKNYYRKVGEFASSVQQIKDDCSRRSLCQLGIASKRTADMMSYGDDRLDDICPRSMVTSLLIDHVVTTPEKQGFDVDCARDSPKRIAMCTQEQLLAFKTDLVDNYNKYICVQDPKHIDKEVFGTKRSSLQAVMKRAAPRRNVQDKETNKEIVQQSTTLMRTTPAKKADEKVIEITESF